MTSLCPQEAPVCEVSSPYLPVHLSIKYISQNRFYSVSSLPQYGILVYIELTKLGTGIIVAVFFVFEIIGKLHCVDIKNHSV